MLDLLDIAEREFPTCSAIEDGDTLVVFLLRDPMRLSLRLSRVPSAWSVSLDMEARILINFAYHKHPAEALRLARAHLEAMFAPLFEALSPPEDGAQEKAHTG